MVRKVLIVFAILCVVLVVAGVVVGRQPGTSNLKRVVEQGTPPSAT
jgi:hypothetical protein